MLDLGRAVQGTRRSVIDTFELASRNAFCSASTALLIEEGFLVIRLVSDSSPASPKISAYCLTSSESCHIALELTLASASPLKPCVTGCRWIASIN